MTDCSSGPCLFFSYGRTSTSNLFTGYSSSHYTLGRESLPSPPEIGCLLIRARHLLQRSSSFLPPLLQLPASDPIGLIPTRKRLATLCTPRNTDSSKKC